MAGLASEAWREGGTPATADRGPVRVDSIRTFDPRVFLGDRLGLALYCRLAQDHLHGRESPAARMYEQFIRHFNEQHEHSTATFRALIDSIRARGFDPAQVVYANPQEHTLKNGIHRTAAAIALGLERIPYNLSFEENRAPDEVFGRVFDASELALLTRWQEELIDACDRATALRCRVRRHMRRHPRSFSAPFSSKTKIPVVRLYQGFARLGLLGKRPTEARVATYGLGTLLDRDMHVLEMGCNNGFLALEIAGHVRAVTAFDVDPAYVAIGQMAAAHLGIRDCEFRVSSVEAFADERTYDCVVACAVHGWLSIAFAEFVATILRFLRPGGILLIESHELDCHPEWAEQKRFLLRQFEVLRWGLIDDVDDSLYASEMREYLVLRRARAAGA
jgi:SAM-dependent methyltransferase